MAGRPPFTYVFEVIFKTGLYFLQCRKQGHKMGYDSTLTHDSFFIVMQHARFKQTLFLPLFFVKKKFDIKRWSSVLLLL